MKMGISLCMIVKNEEDWIEGAIDSVRSLLDEIVIVDTGSTDSTLQRIEQFQPKVIHYKWNDSFADARNAGLKAAISPWILVLDADERIAARDLPAIARAMHSGEDGFFLVQRNYMLANHLVDWTPNDHSYTEGNGYPGFINNPLIRLFRNSPEMRFQGAVHETIDPAKMPSKFRWKKLPVVIHHYGKLRDPERMAAKQQLYLDLGLKKAIEEPGNDRAYLELGFQFHELNRFSEASDCFQKAFDMSKQPRMLLYRAISEKHLGHYTVAVDLIHKAMGLGLNTHETALELGHNYMLLGQPQSAREQFEKSFSLNSFSHLAAFNCGLAARRMGDSEAAASFYAKSLKLEPAYVQAALELASLRLENGCFDEALALLKPIVERRPDDLQARLSLATAFLGAQRPDEAVNSLAPLDTADARIQYLLGTAHLQKSDLDRAQLHLEAAVKKDRSLAPARVNLAQVYRLKGDHGRAARLMMSARMNPVVETAGAPVR